LSGSTSSPLLPHAASASRKASSSRRKVVFMRPV
jgi:hypothetical protein